MISVTVHSLTIKQIETNIMKEEHMSIIESYTMIGLMVKLSTTHRHSIPIVFLDPQTFVQQQFNKPPCRSYLDQGSCEFGLLCKYSHIRLDPYTGK